MIPCFLNPFPDEILYSVWARYSDRVQYSHKASILKELFGNRELKPIIDLPCYLKYFVDNLPPGHSYSIDYFIDHHTLLPFYGPFLPPERLSRIREQMITGEVSALHRHAGIGTSTIEPPFWIRYCPLCVKEDKTNFGESYWHRLHQVPGVEICPTHKIFLENSTIRARSGFNIKGIFSAESTITSTTQRIATSSPFYQALMDIATDARYFLEHLHTPQGTYFLCQQYRALLAQRGFITPRGSVRLKEFLKAFTDYYSQELLALLQCDIKLTGDLHNVWLARMMYSGQSNQSKAVHHPLYHILTIRFLSSSAETFFLSNFRHHPESCVKTSSNQADKDVRTTCAAQRI